MRRVGYFPFNAINFETFHFGCAPNLLALHAPGPSKTILTNMASIEKQINKLSRDSLYNLMNKIQDERNLIDQRTCCVAFRRVNIFSKVTASSFSGVRGGDDHILQDDFRCDKKLWKCMGVQKLFVCQAKAPLRIELRQNPPPLFFCTPFC